MRRHISPTVAQQLVNKNYPHQVEILIPGDGLGEKIMDMHDWAAEIAGQRDSFGHLGFGTTQRHERSTGRDFVRFCFASQVEADGFHAIFGPEAGARRLVSRAKGRGFEDVYIDAET